MGFPLISTFFPFSAEIPTLELGNLGFVTSQRIFKHQFGISKQRFIRSRGQIYDPSGAVRFADTLVSFEVMGPEFHTVLINLLIILVIIEANEMDFVYFSSFCF